MALKHALGTALLFWGSMSITAEASFIINIKQIGSSIVASGSGSFNLLGFGFSGTTPPDASAFIAPRVNGIGVGATGSDDNYLTYVSGPTMFGTGYFYDANSATGDSVGFSFDGDDSLFGVPAGYRSGDSLAGTATFENQSYSSLGLTPGKSYVYTLSGREVAQTRFVSDAVSGNTVTINIGEVGGGGVSAVPLPASAPLFGASLIALGAIGYGFRRKAAMA